MSMPHPIAPDDGQQFLFPPALEDRVPADHPARFVGEFVAQLDLGTLQFVLPEAGEGRPPFASSLLLKIWLYGYFQRIRSTRKLEAACRDQLPLLWLCGLLAPDKPRCGVSGATTKKRSVRSSNKPCKWRCTPVRWGWPCRRWSRPS